MWFPLLTTTLLWCYLRFIHSRWASMALLGLALVFILVFSNILIGFSRLLLLWLVLLILLLIWSIQIALLIAALNTFSICGRFLCTLWFGHVFFCLFDLLGFGTLNLTCYLWVALLSLINFGRIFLLATVFQNFFLYFDLDRNVFRIYILLLLFFLLLLFLLRNLRHTFDGFLNN